MPDSKSNYLVIYNEIVEFLTLSKNDFTVVEEIDLQSNDAMDLQHSRIEEFFRTAPHVSDTERERSFRSLMDGFLGIIEDTAWKCSFTENLHKKLERCLLVLDDQLAQFKKELETSNPGITGIIERKVEMEIPESIILPQSSKKRRRTKNTNSKRTSTEHNDDEAE